MKDKIITIRLKHGGMALHQEGFTISNEGKEVATYNTTVPGGLPYIMIKDGPNKGTWMPVSTNTFMEDITALLTEENVKHI